MGTAVRITGGSAIAMCLDSNHSLMHLDLSWNKVTGVSVYSRLTVHLLLALSHTHSGLGMPGNGRKPWHERPSTLLTAAQLCPCRACSVFCGRVVFISACVPCLSFTRFKIGETNAGIIGAAIENNQVRCTRQTNFSVRAASRVNVQVKGDFV